MQLESDGEGFNIAGAITLEAWIYPKNWTASDTGRVIVNNYCWSFTGAKGWLLGRDYGNADCIHLIINNSYVIFYNFSEKYSNQWVFVVAVYKPSEYMRLYLNGELVAETTTDIPVPCQNVIIKQYQ